LVSLGRPGHAYRWLSKADRDLPGAKLDVEGRRVSIAEYRARLESARSLAEPALPRLHLPLADSATLALADGESLMIPRFADEPGHRWTTFFLGSRSAIRALDSRSGEPLWTHEVTTKSDLELLVAREDVVVFADMFELMALDASSGVPRWRVGTRPDHVADPGGDWEEGGAFRTHAIDGDRLISVRDTGEIAAVAVDTGKMLWRQIYLPGAFGPVRSAHPWVAYHVVENGRAVICVLDADSGARLGSIVSEETRPVEDLFVTIDGRVVMVSSRAISSFDLDRQMLLWQVPVSGQVRPASLALDWDALYLSDTGMDVQKIRLADGSRIWQSDRMAERGVDDLVVRLVGTSLLASTSSSVVAIDTNTGLTLWHGTTPERPRLEHRLVTDRYLAAVDTSGQVREEPCMVYLYTHADGSGVIPANGGGLNLGPIGKIKSAMAVDGAMILQAGSELQIHRSKAGQ
jgi:outer membrane protein assembly factor BamB